MTEEGIKQLAAIIAPTNPELADLLLHSRYVDDLNTSMESLKKCKELAAEADKWFSALGMECKGWIFSGTPPPEDTSKDGTVGVAGMAWDPEVDTLEVKIPSLHFGRIARGRITTGTNFFEGGSLTDLDKFVPRNLTKRMVASKFLSIFDLLGHLLSLTAWMK